MLHGRRFLKEVSMLGVEEQVVESSVSISPNALQVFIESWKDVDLDRRRLEIDRQALTMYDNDQKSVNSRGDLANSIREMKTLKGEDRNKALTKTLKQFQKEVDDLTERAKFAENSFQSLYKTLYQAPDPVSLLTNLKVRVLVCVCVFLSVVCQVVLERSIRLEAENKESRKALEQYEEEFKTIKNQEVTVRKLKEENALLQDKLRSKADELIVEQKQKFETQMEEAVSRFQQREDELMEQLKASKDSLMQLHSSYDNVQTQLFKFTAQQGKLVL
jgi:homeobox protein cut-like